MNISNSATVAVKNEQRANYNDRFSPVEAMLMLGTTSAHCKAALAPTKAAARSRVDEDAPLYAPDRDRSFPQEQSPRRSHSRRAWE